MADIKLLHWNIQTFADSKLRNVNAAALITYVCAVVKETNANIVSLLEIHTPYAKTIADLLLAALAGSVRPSPWQYLWVDSGEREAYIMLFKLGHEFTSLKDKKSGQAICGLTNQATVTEKKGSLVFCSPSSKRGGRQPFYVAFQTSEEKKFTVIAYHAMYGADTPFGVANAGQVAQNTSVLYGGVAVALDNSFPAGDYNVFYDPKQPAYENFMALPSVQATNERTTLKRDSPPGGFDDPKRYRVSAYDNIFCYKKKPPYPDAPVGLVIDLIDDSTKMPPGSGTLTDAITAFSPKGVERGHLLGNIPPLVYEDAWHIVRYSISDHLPVFVTLSV